jgi:hypothetical protein
VTRFLRSRAVVALLAPLVAAATLVALSGCAPATGPHPNISSIGHAPTKPHITPKPKPTVATLAPPVPRYPFTCAQIAPTATLATALNHALTTTSPFDPGDLMPYAYIEDGALYCGLDSTSSADDETNFALVAMPDVAAADFTGWAGTYSGGTPGVFGPNSYYTCDVPTNQIRCSLDALVGSTWLTVTAWSNDAGTLTQAQVDARMKPIFQNEINLVKSSAIAEPRWSDPTAGPVSGTADSGAEDQRLAGLMGLAWQVDVYVPDLIGNGPQVEAFVPINFYERGGGAGNDSIAVDMLPSGGWAWNQIVAASSSEPGYTTLPGLGDKAFSVNVVTTYEPRETTIDVVKNHDLYSIEVSTDNTGTAAAVQATAEKVAAAVLTEIG